MHSNKSTALQPNLDVAGTILQRPLDQIKRAAQVREFSKNAKFVSLYKILITVSCINPAKVFQGDFIKAIFCFSLYRYAWRLQVLERPLCRKSSSSQSVPSDMWSSLP